MTPFLPSDKFSAVARPGNGCATLTKIAEVRNYMLNRSSNAAKTWVVVFVGALVLALAAFLVLSTSPDSTFAQASDMADMIMYAENGTDPVRTYSSEDPEGAGINWDVTGIDADYFEISGGVLTFKNPPDYESPMDKVHGILDRNRDGDTTDTAEGIDVAASDADNMYQITIRASEMRESGDMGRALSTETHVTIGVTDVNEGGMVTINLRQPEVGTPIMASVTDPDGTNRVAWQWSVSTVTNPVAMPKTIGPMLPASLPRLPPIPRLGSQRGTLLRGLLWTRPNICGPWQPTLTTP